VICGRGIDVGSVSPVQFTSFVLKPNLHLNDTNYTMIMVIGGLID